MPFIECTSGTQIEGDASPETVLSGSTFMSTSSDEVQTGTMTNQGAISVSVDPTTSEQVKYIPAGYHNGEGTVTVNPVQLSGTATGSSVLEGQTFYSDSLQKQTGQIVNRGDAVLVADPNTKAAGWLYDIPDGYYQGGHIQLMDVELNGNADAASVLSGKTFYNTVPGGVGVVRIPQRTGTMPNNGAVSATISPSSTAQAYTIPEGYHDGTGTVTCEAVSLEGDATASTVLKGKTFYSNSLTLSTGTMTNKGAWGTTITPTAESQQVSVPWGYHNGAGKITVEGVSLTGNATSSQVAAGATYYSDSLTQQTGTMTNNGAWEQTVTPSSEVQEVTIPEGYHNGSGKITIGGVTFNDVYLGWKNGSSSTQTISCTSIPNYQNLTVSNFILATNGCQLNASGGALVMQDYALNNKSTIMSIKSYNASTGVLTLQGGYFTHTDTGKIEMRDKVSVHCIYI